MILFLFRRFLELIFSIVFYLQSEIHFELIKFIIYIIHSYLLLLFIIVIYYSYTNIEIIINFINKY